MTETADGGQGGAAAAGGQATGGTGSQLLGGQQDGGTGGGQQPAVPDWAKDWEPELQGLATSQGWKDPRDGARQYHELQRVFSADRAGRTVVLPKDEADTDGWGAVYSKLGRPETAEGYGLDKVDGADPDFAKAMGSTFHKAGLSAGQAKALTEAYAAEGARIREAQETAFAAQADKDILDLKRGWGPQYDAKVQAGQAAARQFGFTGEDLDKIERAIGTKALLERFADIGAKLGQDTLPGGASSAGGDPVSAKARIETLKKDKEFSAKLSAGDPTAKAEWDNLHKLAFSKAA